MTAFEIVVILVVVAGTVLGVASLLSPTGTFESLGRVGAFWFDHDADRPIGERPSEDDRDPPLPRRPLRGRPQ